MTTTLKNKILTTTIPDQINTTGNSSKSCTFFHPAPIRKPVKNLITSKYNTVASKSSLRAKKEEDNDDKQMKKEQNNIYIDEEVTHKEAFKRSDQVVVVGSKQTKRLNLLPSKNLKSESSKKRSEEEEEQQESSMSSEDSGSGEEELDGIENDRTKANTLDDNYESANDDDSNSSQKQQVQRNKQVAPALSSTVGALKSSNDTRQQSASSSGSFNNNRTRQVQLTSTRHSNSIIKHNNNLARGRQQRASISSCSSSDSYASYGSGYASGSGNSTDHELKQQRSLNNNIINSPSSEEKNTQTVTVVSESDNKFQDTSTAPSTAESTIKNTSVHSEVTVADASCDDNEEENDDDDVEEDEVVDIDGGNDEDGDESQLKRHLSELEQLTDELANRKIFGIITQAAQPASSDSKHHKSTHHHHHHHHQNRHQHSSSNASTINSTSSSILSTGSNVSSLLSSASSSSSSSSSTVALEDSLDCPASSNPGACQLTVRDTRTGESRSTSATPTSSVQEQVLSCPSSYKPAYINRIRSSNNEEMAVQVQLDKPSQQYALPLKNQAPKAKITLVATPQRHQQPQAQQTPQQQQLQKQPQQVVTKSTSSIGTSNNKQEPYYHNQLFQWEQLVSKGVTRPLLINGLDFTDLRDEDDCDLLNSSSYNNGNNQNGKLLTNYASNGKSCEPLTINIPAAQQNIQNSLNLINEQESLNGGGESPKARSNITASNAVGTPASAPPPMPPPPISPWFNTISNSSIYSSQRSSANQFLSSPSPPCEYSAGSINNNNNTNGAHNHQTLSGEFCRDQSPANSTYSNYSRNSVCLAQTNTSTRDSSMATQQQQQQQQQYNIMQQPPTTTTTSLRSASSMSSLLFGNNGGKYMNKRKKTMKLFWKEVREDRSLLAKLTKKHTIWDEIKPVQIDTQKLESLFESKAKDLMLSKSRIGLDSLGQRKVKITVLDAKRSNAINIGMTKLPPMRTIKSAILKMDSSIMNREGIEKILSTMMPSEEEKSRIIEAQLANPDTPLGTAEQFLLNLASISALEARLKLWAFQLDYAQIEKEVAEPLMDLKQAIDEIERCETFRIILGTLLAIGNFLNSTNAKGFQIDYLEKVPEVKDTVHKHSLLHHLCLFIQEKYDPQSTSDLYSEFSAVNRASKVDYAEVAKNLKKMQQDCKSSWDYLKIVTKHDGLANLMNTCNSSTSSPQTNEISSSTLNNSTTAQQPKSSGKLNNLSKLSMITTVMNVDKSGSLSSNEQQQSSNQSSNNNNNKHLKTRVSDFLTDCAERIMVLMVIHRRVMNRFQKLLVYLGCPSHQIKQTQPQQILKIINEFALEYRTKRERVREMLAKKQNCQHRHHQHHHLSNRWQMSRSRWAGSQQCMDTLGYNSNNNNNRPCSTTSSCASSYAANSTCNGSMCNISLTGESRNLANHGGQRAGSPSGFSQASNYSDYLFDQSCCNSRQQSITPVPTGEKGTFSQQQQQQQHLTRRPHSMSVSMFDLQNQQQQNCSLVTSSNTSAKDNQICNVNNNHNHQDEEVEQQIQKDAQLRRILGAGKSMDGTCKDLYQMSHWTSTMSRVTRHPAAGYLKQRAASIDSTSKDDELDSISKGQSSYYRYLPMQCSIDDETEQNSDDEILQSLVRTATAKSTHISQNNLSAKSGNNGTSHQSSTNKGAKNKILSRFNCDRKSIRGTLRGGIEISDVGQC